MSRHHPPAEGGGTRAGWKPDPRALVCRGKGYGMEDSVGKSATLSFDRGSGGMFPRASQWAGIARQECLVRRTHSVQTATGA